MALLPLVVYHLVFCCSLVNEKTTAKTGFDYFRQAVQKLQLKFSH